MTRNTMMCDRCVFAVIKKAVDECEVILISHTLGSQVMEEERPDPSVVFSWWQCCARSGEMEARVAPVMSEPSTGLVAGISDGPVKNGTPGKCLATLNLIKVKYVLSNT